MLQTIDRCLRSAEHIVHRGTRREQAFEDLYRVAASGVVPVGRAAMSRPGRRRGGIDVMEAAAISDPGRGGVEIGWLPPTGGLDRGRAL